jgi:mannose-6-phosphate isomerase-like protein (cupin superfamily)
MNNITEFIDSGILESYVMGIATAEEVSEVELMLTKSDEVRKEIDEIAEALERYAELHGETPNVTVRPFVLATIDYSERMKNGERPSEPPSLHDGSKPVDYEEWLNRPEMSLPEDFKDLHARIIGYTPQILTAIVWIKDMAPTETHDNEFEKFLIVEGSCNIIIGDEVHQLAAGDFLSIPLYKDHFVHVTSPIPCKVILQRVAA